MIPLAQPPKKDERTFDDWMYRMWKRISDAAGLAWSLVDKTGSNLTDIETRNHADLQNINTASYTHLTAANHTDLTDGGDSTLHQHARYMDVATYDVDADGVVDSSENIVIHVRNATGSTITKGSTVYINGATGQRPTVTLAKADAEATSSKTLGVISADLLNNGDGYAIVIGRLANLDTSAFVDGDALWLSATVAGGITNSVPADPNHAVFIGYCAYSQNNNGIIIVNIHNGYELTELHDVVITTPSDGQFLHYESATGLWKNSAALGTPTSGALDNCTTNTEDAGTNNTQLANTAHVFAERTNTATLTNKTLTSGLATATLADNTATLGLADAKFVKSQIANDCNAHQHAQSVTLTYAASGSTGITVADNSNIDFGTSDFSLAWEGSLPDWTPSAVAYLINKNLDASAGYRLALNTNGTVVIYLYRGSATSYSSTASPAFTDGTSHVISASIQRETASIAGSISFYVDGIQLGAAVAIPVSDTGAGNTIDNSALVYISGISGTRQACTCKSALTYNRALSAADVLDLYRNGINFADKWGSQTNNVTGTNADFSGAGNWLPNTDITLTTAYDSGDAGHATCLRIQGSGAGLTNWKGAYLAAAYQGFVADKRQRVKFNYKWVINNSGGGMVYFGASGPQSNTFPVTSGWANYNGVATVTGVETVSVTSGGNSAFELLIDDFEVYDAGATLALESEGIQPNQWHDSANNLHAAYPTAGASLTRWKETGLYEWTTAITADTTLTSIVPAGYELEKISFKNSTTNAVSVRLGTTAGGTDIFGLTALNISTTLGGYKTVLCNQGFSTTAAQTLYLSSTAWSSASLTFTMYFRRIS